MTDQPKWPNRLMEDERKLPEPEPEQDESAED